MKKQVPTFMGDYASYIIENHFPEGVNDLIHPGIKSELTNRVYRILGMYREGKITVEEAMGRLSGPFFSWEDLSRYEQ